MRKHELTFGLIAIIWAISLSMYSPTIEARGGHSSGGRIHVKAYTKKDGTYVPAHNRTAPNNTKKDNWSTKGNVNPETGKVGTKDADH